MILAVMVQLLKDIMTLYSRAYLYEDLLILILRNIMDLSAGEWKAKNFW